MAALEYLRSKQLHRWGVDYVRHLATRRRESVAFQGTRHLVFSFCDHWEPLFDGVGDAQADARVLTWSRDYPVLADRFRDADGVRPQHSFFFPGEHYRPRWLDALADLSRRGFGEVELHLHHDGDTSASLGSDVQRYVREIASHGHLSRDGERLRFAFIHGNWCLANARADGRFCGVDDEVALLHALGCYADFTFPAPENEAQPRVVNQLWWPTGDLSRRRAYEDGERARVGARYDDRMLFVSGPSAISLRRARLPLRLESSAITASDPATPERVRLWGDLGITVSGRPDWVFVKMHTHGAPESQAASLLGEPGARLHEELGRQYNDGKAWKLHYVTARETYNIALAAMDGRAGDPNDFRDYALARPPVRS